MFHGMGLRVRAPVDPMVKIMELSNGRDAGPQHLAEHFCGERPVAVRL
jgi:hypothetical protein